MLARKYCKFYFTRCLCTCLLCKLFIELKFKVKYLKMVCATVDSQIKFTSFVTWVSIHVIMLLVGRQAVLYSSDNR